MRSSSALTTVPPSWPGPTPSLVRPDPLSRSRRTLTRALASIALLITAGFIVAEDPAPAAKTDLMAQFQAADTDQDGTVSADELAAVTDEAAKK